MYVAEFWSALQPKGILHQYENFSNLELKKAGLSEGRLSGSHFPLIWDGQNVLQSVYKVGVYTVSIVP